MYLFLLEHAEEWLNSNIRCIEMPCNTEYEYATDS